MLKEKTIGEMLKSLNSLLESSVSNDTTGKVLETMLDISKRTEDAAAHELSMKLTEIMQEDDPEPKILAYLNGMAGATQKD